MLFRCLGSKVKFIPNSSIKQEMLNEINLDKIDGLYLDIPNKIKIKGLNLDKGLSQQETYQKLKKISTKNIPTSKILCFLGGGIKQHFVPPVVKAITSRSEFYTAYTPYQPEASQGFLQAMFEYQSMITEITGMDVANCSLYDGFTALSEAVLMSSRITKKNKFLIPGNIFWEKKSILCNYAKGPNIEITEIPYDLKTGKINLEILGEKLDSNTAGVYIENPNFFGVFEDSVSEIKKMCSDVGALLVVGIDPLSIGIIKSPGDYGADIVIGEGRSLGNQMDFGGSTLGIFACKKDYLRQMPGRIIGMTKDSEGKRAFCMALQTREQHIRRGKATSNICTNEGLCALAACTYLAWLGGTGLEKISKKNFDMGKKLCNEITSIDAFTKQFSGIHFNEFVIKSKKPIDKINKKLLSRQIHGGLILSPRYPELKNCFLLGITEMYDDEDIKRFVEVLREVSDV